MKPLFIAGLINPLRRNPVLDVNRMYRNRTEYVEASPDGGNSDKRVLLADLVIGKQKND